LIEAANKASLAQSEQTEILNKLMHATNNKNIISKAGNSLFADSVKGKFGTDNWID
jgi:hypothetical protein